jgi:hypothetical protein
MRKSKGRGNEAIQLNSIQQHYHNIMGNPLSAMTLRIGLVDFDDGLNQELVSDLINRISKIVVSMNGTKVAEGLYNGQTPIIRFVADKKHTWDKQEGIRYTSLCISAGSKTGNKSSNGFILKHIILHTDLIIVNNTGSNQNKINTCIQGAKLLDDIPSIIVVNDNYDYYPSSELNDVKNIDSSELNTRLETELKDYLLFHSLINCNEGEGKNKELNDKIISLFSTYEKEKKHLTIDSKTNVNYIDAGYIIKSESFIKWHKFFDFFVHIFVKSQTNEKEGNQYTESCKDRKVYNLLFAQFIRADQLATYYSHVYRSTFLAIFLLGALALITAVLAVGFHQCPKFVLAMATSELILLIIISKLFYMDRKHKYHVKWLEYRSLAEILRLMALQNSIGLPQSVNSIVWHCKDMNGKTHPTGKSGRIWLIIYSKILIRSISYDKQDIEQETLQKTCTFLVDEILENQNLYHRENIKKMDKTSDILSGFSNWLFILTIVLVIIKITLKFFPLEFLFGPIPIGHYCGIGAAICPILASAFFAIKSHAEFEISSQGSESMLKKLSQEINAFSCHSTNGSYKHTAKHIQNTSIMMQEETVKWLEIYQCKDIEPA